VIKWIKELFLPAEVKVIINLIKQFLKEHPSLGTQEIEKQTINIFIKNKEDTVKSVTVYKKNPNMLMLSAMIRVIEHNLRYGNLYQYRGFLNFQGEEIFKLSNIVINEMLKNKFTSEKEANDYKKILIEIIKNNG